MNGIGVCCHDTGRRQKESRNAIGTLAGSVPIGDLSVGPTVERDSTCVLWPHTWKQDDCLIAVDGYIVWPDGLMLGRCPNDMHKMGTALLKDPIRWLREVHNGCFNVVVHDYRRKRTLFASDRFGFLPLYILRGEGRWWFASDLESLRDIVPYQPELDKTGLAELYWFGYQIGDRTAYKEVRVMPAGTVISLSWLDGSVTEETWAKLTEPYRDHDCVNIEDAPSQYVELVTAACNRLYNPSLRYGITLSGGMDSRMIAACWRDKPACTYTWGDEGSAETRIAAKVAKRLGFQHTEIPVQGDFFRTVYPPMFKKYGLMEFVSGIGVTSMLNNGTQVVLDGIMNDRLFAISRKCEETWREKLRWTLGLEYRSTPISVSNDAIAETIYHQIRKGDEYISFIPACFKHEIDGQRDFILQDITREVEKFRREEDSLEAVIEKVNINNRARRYVSLTCALSRPRIQTCFPFLDNAVVDYSDRIRYVDKANQRFLIKVYSDVFPHMRSIPPLMSLLPFYVPDYVHCYGRMWRYLREVVGERVFRLSHGYVQPRAMDAFQWPRWLASNADFREGITEYLADSPAVDSRRLSKFMKSVSSYRTWVTNTRLMLTPSYCAWYKPEYAGNV